MRRFDEAYRELQRSYALNPTSLIAASQLGSALYYAGQYQKAVEQFRLVLATSPGFYHAHYGLGLACEGLGRHEDALAEIQQAINLGGRMPVLVTMLGYADGMCGRQQEAARVLEELMELRRRGLVSPYNLAVVCLGLKDWDRMFQFLREANDDGSPWIIWMNVDPKFDPVRHDPRFLELLGRIGVPRDSSSQPSMRGGATAVDELRAPRARRGELRPTRVRDPASPPAGLKI